MLKNIYEKPYLSEYDEPCTYQITNDGVLEYLKSTKINKFVKPEETVIAEIRERISQSEGDTCQIASMYLEMFTDMPSERVKELENEVETDTENSIEPKGFEDESFDTDGSFDEDEDDYIDGREIGNEHCGVLEVTAGRAFIATEEILETLRNNKEIAELDIENERVIKLAKPGDILYVVSLGSNLRMFENKTNTEDIITDESVKFKQFFNLSREESYVNSNTDEQIVVEAGRYIVDFVDFDFFEESMH